MVKHVWILAGLDELSKNMETPIRNGVIVSFPTEDLAKEYQKAYGLSFCTQRLMIPFYESKAEILK